MKNGFIFVVFPLCVWGQNVVFNPGFDMTPWDTGWTVEVDSFYYGNASASAKVVRDSGMSLPNCCYLKTYAIIPAGAGGYARAEASIYQKFDKVINSRVKVYVKYLLGVTTAIIGIQLYTNNQWDTIWSIEVYDAYHGINYWDEISVNVNDTVSGIKIYGYSEAWRPGSSGSNWVGFVNFWIDSIYITGEPAIEETDMNGPKDLELSIYPNPFVRYTIINLPCEQTKVRIYDMMGRLVDEPTGTVRRVIGENLSEGVYFVKLNGSTRAVKIVKIGRYK